MNVTDYMKQMKRRSKADDIPGTVKEYLDTECPACGKKLKRYKPCCGSKYGYDGCVCEYKINLDADSV